MEEKKIWFIGYTRRFWVPISIEGWLTTGAFFAGGLCVGALNNASSEASLTVSQAIPIALEFICVIAIFYFITKGHVDKRY